MSSPLTPEAFCRTVEQTLQQRRPGLAVSVTVEDAHFVVRMERPDRTPNTWRWPVAEPAYDAALGEPWSEDQAAYLALLAEEENTGYLADRQER